ADHGDAYVIETSGAQFAVEQVGDVRAISNRTTIPAFDAVHRHPGQPVERLVDPRWEASQRALAQQPVTAAALADHLRSHDSCAEEGWSVCMHVEGVEATSASMIVTLPSSGSPEALMLVGHPCQQEYETYVV
ncbi:unnamed protein product, partial [Phaeothamnion confervicola]